jgi:hypothetical protein
MDQSSKPPPDGAAILDELKRALDGAARCIELAKREGARIDAALRAQPAGGVPVEQTLLENARKRREQLSLFDLRFELPPSPPQEPPPAAPLSRDEKSVLEEAPQPLTELLPVAT